MAPLPEAELSGDSNGDDPDGEFAELLLWSRSNEGYLSSNEISAPGFEEARSAPGEYSTLVAGTVAVFELERAALSAGEAGENDVSKPDELLTPLPTPGCRLFDVVNGDNFCVEALRVGDGAKEFSKPKESEFSPCGRGTPVCEADFKPSGSKASEKSAANCLISLTSCG